MHALLRCFLLVLLATATHAYAQVTPEKIPSFGVELRSIGDRATDPLNINYLSLAECEAGAVLLFEVHGVPATTPFVDVYIGDGSCADSSMRADPLILDCMLLMTASVDSADKLSISIGADRLDCTGGIEFQPRFWFLGVHSSGSDEDVGTDYGTFAALNVDLFPPSAPTDVHAAVGDRSVRVSWHSDQDHLRGFVVFVDPEAS